MRRKEDGRRCALRTELELANGGSVSRGEVEARELGRGRRRVEAKERKEARRPRVRGVAEGGRSVGEANGPYAGERAAFTGRDTVATKCSSQFLCFFPSIQSHF